MCLVAFAVDAHPQHRLVLMGNRDEVFGRPAAPLARWEDAPHVVAGRDLDAGGTWLGVADGGRWAVLTNVRDPLNSRPKVKSRGVLPAEFLLGSASALAYAQAVSAARGDFDGFNLVVGDAETVAVVSTRTDGVTTLGPGIYGLSNDRLDTPWPKVVRARRHLRDALRGEHVAPADLLARLDDTERAPDADLPETGVGLELERVLSPIRIAPFPMRIAGGPYGTRVSTALLLDRTRGGRIVERTWRPDGAASSETTEEIPPGP